MRAVVAEVGPQAADHQRGRPVAEQITLVVIAPPAVGVATPSGEEARTSLVPAVAVAARAWAAAGTAAAAAAGGTAAVVAVVVAAAEEVDVAAEGVDAGDEQLSNRIKIYEIGTKY